MNIEGKICRLRALEPQDLDAMYNWENNIATWRVSGTVAPFSRHILSRLIDEQQYDIFTTRQMRLVIEDIESNDVVGAVDLFEYDPLNRRAGIGIIVDPNHRQQGFAHDALCCIEEYGRVYLHLHQLWCSTLSDNEASIKLFAKAGYQECGRRKDWIIENQGPTDEILMQKILE